MHISDLHELPRSAKHSIFLTVDTLLIPLSLFVAFALRYGTPWPVPMMQGSWVLFPIVTLLGTALICALKIQRIKLEGLENRAILRIATGATALMFMAMIVSYLLNLSAPRSVPIIMGTVFFLGSIGVRILGLAVLTRFAAHEADRKPVAIFGAGAAGIQLAMALQRSKEARPVFFVDDNINLQGLMVAGLPVYKPSNLDELIEKRKIRQVLLAIPSISESRRNDLIKGLLSLNVEVKVLPSYIDMMSGNSDGALKPVTPDALLGRDKVDLHAPEIAEAYANRVVMVTGAGGSIGSELCRQLLNCNPTRIVLFEQSEFALYSIDKELMQEASKRNIAVTARLGSVTNPQRVRGVIAEEGVEIILHAAAYKHVPLVEDNELEGVRNNVIGTQVVADAARHAGIERFILVSTDKAVRPTNVMGATKRMAELVIQDLATRSDTTRYAMVRFGNVLGSSGSVLPLFQKQLSAGGPLTVTHPEVTRFFMTIPEAARLVLLAGAYAQGGDVFVLDMGQPQKISDIARQMITLSGRSVKDPSTGVGDIEIVYTGLRPGEKLYEELLIDDDSLRATPHPKIMRAEENMLSQIEVASMVRDIHTCLDDASANRLRDLIANRVEGYHKQVLDEPTEKPWAG
ncbi:polysaccharide biosynthesis protein [Shimia litoralis]|uniref:Polysaccharide biosynthesis protein n=1 Tax=Shimia litoralis TaxID=420403 RepID=A0A4U7N2F2_9RHOB|nr:nucleoside-diphosphate sugar epimerase/dehydratase [Shimia litoralis]TKZ19346.1 polysaccharide biosynthesis protein [Shimia litoralis]